jgi:acyl carrier protein phosphodiesterase
VNPLLSSETRTDSVNFLAHLHLADPDPGLMLGGIVADFARPAEVAALPPDVRRGVTLHRQIDGFTDRHPLVHRCIGRVSQRMGWFAGIVIDIYFDHLLARGWPHYSAEPLAAFAERAYRTLEDQFALAPPDAQGFIRTFIDHRLITEYGTVAGITETLARVARKIAARIPKRAVWLPDAIPDLQAADADLAADFHGFYPELMAFVAHQRAFPPGE